MTGTDDATMATRPITVTPYTVTLDAAAQVQHNRDVHREVDWAQRSIGLHHDRPGGVAAGHLHVVRLHGQWQPGHVDHAPTPRATTRSGTPRIG